MSLILTVFSLCLFSQQPAGGDASPLNWFGGKESKGGQQAAQGQRSGGKGGHANAKGPEVEAGFEPPKSKAEQMHLARRLQHDRFDPSAPGFRV